MKMPMAPRALPDLALFPLIAIALFLGGPLQGQTYQEVAPKPVREGVKPVVVAPALPPKAPVRDQNQVLVPNLTGLRLVPSPDRIGKTAAEAAQPLVIEDLPWLTRGRAEAITREFISRPLTRGDLARLVRALVLLSRQLDRPVVDIFAPPQDVSGGVVQLVVLVAKRGQLRVEGNQYFADHVMLHDVRVQANQEITGQQLLEDMDLINQNPFRQVDLVYARGAEPGLTDIVLRVHDERPDRVYVGYDDTGNQATGLGRVFAGFNLGDVFHQDEQLSYQYTKSTDGDRLQAHSASYTIPLPWRNTFEIFGDWAQAKAVSGGGLFDLTGVNWQVGARYRVPLPMIGTNYTHSLNFGADYKWSNNNLEFGGTQVFTSPVNLVEGVLGYTGVRVDATGSTQGSVTGFYSPGGIGGLNHEKDFLTQRSGANIKYEYLQATLSRVQKLPDGYTAVLTTLGQWTSDRLLPSDQFGVGGATSVRGYDERIVNGDDGISGQLELRTPAWHLLKGIPDRTQFLVFVDAGRDWIHNPVGTETDNTLAGAGPGLRMNIGNNGTIKADYGWELKRLPGTRTGRVHLSAILSY